MRRYVLTGAAEADMGSVREIPLGIEIGRDGYPRFATQHYGEADDGVDELVYFRQSDSGWDQEVIEALPTDRTPGQFMLSRSGGPVVVVAQPNALTFEGTIKHFCRDASGDWHGTVVSMGARHNENQGYEGIGAALDSGNNAMVVFSREAGRRPDGSTETLLQLIAQHDATWSPVTLAADVPVYGSGYADFVCAGSMPDGTPRFFYQTLEGTLTDVVFSP